MKAVFILGHEMRVLTAATRVVDNERVDIPEAWTSVAICGGVDLVGVVRMWMAQTGIVAPGRDIDSAEKVFRRTQELFPINGEDLAVRRHSVSGIDKRLYALRDYHMWTPARDMFDKPDSVITGVTGKVVGYGVGIERAVLRGAIPRAGLFLVPYYAAVMEEHFEDGNMFRRVVPVRWYAPYDPESQLTIEDPPTSEFLPEFIAKLMEQAPFGTDVTFSVHGATSHYELDDISCGEQQQQKPAAKPSPADALLYAWNPTAGATQ